MARIESIKFHPHFAVVHANKIVWAPNTGMPSIDTLPQIFWSNGRPWREANLWAYDRAYVEHKNWQTILADISALTGYAKWLEQTDTQWWDFPERKKDRCLFRYRGALIDARNEGVLAPSTVSERMRVVITFYRWLKEQGLLSTAWPMWRDRIVQLKWADNYGLSRSLAVNSSELSIPNRSQADRGPEGGLLPISVADRDLLMSFARSYASEELYLLLALGFGTGMRLGTLADLKLQTLDNAVADPRCGDLYRITVGPGARPSVTTKFGVTGAVYIPLALLSRLRIYASSTRRLLREAKASDANKNLVFLTKFGNPYVQRGVNKSVAVNVEMFTLRKKAFAAGIAVAKNFWFHQSRATFGTELARIALKYGKAHEAVAIVMEALLQRSESSALHYIHFVENSPIKAELANEFTRSFLGVFESRMPL